MYGFEFSPLTQTAAPTVNVNKTTDEKLFFFDELEEERKQKEMRRRT